MVRRMESGQTFRFQDNDAQIELSPTEFENLVQVFRILSKWQQDLDARKAAAIPQGDSRTRNDLSPWGKQDKIGP